MFGTNPPRVYQYQGMGGADVGAQNAIGGLQGAAAATGYNPSQTVQQGQNIIGSVGQLPQYANQALQAGFDPGNQYYNDMFNRNQQQALATQAQQGVAMTPYGAGLTQEANDQFNQSWWNNTLARQGQGMNTALAGLGGYGSGVTAGANLQQAGALLPAQLQQQQIGDWLSYLSGGTQAQQTNLNRWGQQQKARNDLWSGIGNLVGAGLGSKQGQAGLAYLGL